MHASRLAAKHVDAALVITVPNPRVRGLPSVAALGKQQRAVRSCGQAPFGGPPPDAEAVELLHLARI